MMEPVIALAWYLGIVGNSFLSMIFLICGFCILVKNKNSQYELNKVEYRFAGISLVTFSITTFSIVLLYIQSYLTKSTLFPKETLFPMVMWVGNLLYFIFLFLTSIYTVKANNKINLSICTICAFFGFLNGLIGLNKYSVVWGEGNVVVYYFNNTTETINSIIVIFCISYSFYLLLSSYLDEETNYSNYETNKVLWMSIAYFITILTFFIPRTDPWSITDSISVKILSYIFFYGFLGLFVISLVNAEKFSLKIKNLIGTIYPEEKKQFFSSFLQNMRNKTKFIVFIDVFAIFGIFLLFFVFKIGQSFVNDYEYAKDAVNEGIAVYIGEWNGIFWYLHIYGALFPLLIALILLVIRVTVSKYKSKTIALFFVFWLAQMIPSYILNNILGFYIISEDSYYPFILGFIIPPIILIITYTLYRNEELISCHNYRFVLKNYFPIEVFSSTILSTISIDFLNTYSPTGKILVGGGGIIDGIIIVSILSVLLTLIFVSNAFLLSIKIFENKVQRSRR